MKKNTFVLSILIAFAALTAFAVEPALYWSSEDASPVIRVKNTGSDQVSMMMNTTGLSWTVNIGECANTITCANGDTAAELAAAVAACTNVSGVAPLVVDSGCSLAADVTKNSYVVNTATTNISTDRKWVVPFAWNTDVALHYDAYVPGKLATGGNDTRKIVQRIVGDIGGTGNVTLNVYIDGVKKYQRTITSPVYVLDLMNTNAVNAVVTLGNPDADGCDINIPIPRDSDCIIRATRATTGSTGGIGAVVDFLK